VAGGVKYNPKNGGKLLAPPPFHFHALETWKSGGQISRIFELGIWTIKTHKQTSIFLTIKDK